MYRGNWGRGLGPQWADESRDARPRRQPKAPQRGSCEGLAHCILSTLDLAGNIIDGRSEGGGGLGWLLRLVADCRPDLEPITLSLSFEPD